MVLHNPVGKLTQYVVQIFLLLFGSLSYKACQKPVFVTFGGYIFVNKLMMTLVMNGVDRSVT
jgi:hypothetical protein